jgi:hypothetical protein
MGHQRLSGFVCEVTLGGAPMLQVNVPEAPAVERHGQSLAPIPGFTTFVSAASLYRLTPCEEEVARLAVEQWRAEPVSCVRMPELAALPAPAITEDQMGELYPEDDEP